MIKFNILFTCGDSNCDVIWQDWMDICPDSLDHKGWEDEGLLREVCKHFENILPLLKAEEEEIRIIREFIHTKENTIFQKENAKIKNIILKYAPFTLLTTGWGLLEESTNNPNDIIKRNYEPMKKDSQNYKKIFYLIYKKRNRK